jgi:hypothetical protein
LLAANNLPFLQMGRDRVAPHFLVPALEISITGLAWDRASG